MNPRKPKSPAIEEVAGFVTVHVALPGEILKSIVKTAKEEGHRDISLVIRRALEKAADNRTMPCFALLGI